MNPNYDYYLDFTQDLPEDYDQNEYNDYLVEEKPRFSRIGKMKWHFTPVNKKCQKIIELYL